MDCCVNLINEMVKNNALIPRLHETTRESSQPGEFGTAHGFTATYLPICTPGQWESRYLGYLYFSDARLDTKYCTMTESSTYFILEIRTTVWVCIIGAKLSKSYQSYDFDSH